MPGQSRNFHYLLHSAHLVEEGLRKRLAPLGVQPRQARILDAISRIGTPSQVRLAEELSVTEASMSSMIARLRELGFVHRNADPTETRSNRLTLSPRGRDLLETVYKLWSETDREIESLIGVEDARELTAATLRLRDALGGFTPGENDGIP